MAYDTDNYNVVYKAVVCSTGTTVASGNNALVGQNQRMLNNTGSTTTGNSANAVHIGNTLTTAAFPVRIVGVVDVPRRRQLLLEVLLLPQLLVAHYQMLFHMEQT